jgi:hypothetical protein
MFRPRDDWAEGLQPADRWLEQYGLAGAVGGDQTARLSLGWTVAMTEQTEVINQIEAIMAAVPCARRAAIGFLSPELDQEATRPPYFGVIIYADVTDGFETSESLGRSIRVNGTEFAVVVRRGAFESHGSKAGPPGSYAGPPRPSIPPREGQVAYWGHSRQGLCHGWVTAKHVADNLARVLGGRVVDRAPECLDAALVDDGAGPRGPHVAAYQSISAGLDVVLNLPQPMPAQVLDVDACLHLMRWSSRFPLRIAFNAHGVFGDSGSAVYETRTPAETPLGIYLGSFTPAQLTTFADGKAGYALALCQLEKLIGLEIHS